LRGRNDSFSPSELFDRVIRGETRAVARLLSRLENRRDGSSSEILGRLYPLTEGGCVVGVTGSPGTGKSTLVDGLAQKYLAAGEKVGVVAVDPTSPFTGGALLGDRIRMRNLSVHPNAFMRSMATRGRLGGLAPAVGDVLVVLAAAGYRRLVVETVGVGQDEVDVAKNADVTIVVLVPGLGDEIQAIKAGIMEIGDIFVVNKADREGAEQMARMIRASLPGDGPWTPPVVQTVATRGEGINELLRAVEDFRIFLGDSTDGRTRKMDLERQRILDLVRDRLLSEILDRCPEERLTRLAEEVAARRTDPYTIVESLLGERTS
jgi:LAO/AO transport system kinase